MITEEELRLAILKVDLLLKQRQAAREPWEAFAMMLIAAAAIVAVSGLPAHFWPPQPQQINIRLEQPIAIKLEP